MFYPQSWTRSKRTPLGLALLSMTAIALLALLTAQPGFAQTHATNPFANAIFYVNPDWTAEANSATAQAPSLANQIKLVGNYPTAVWLDRMAAIAGGSVNNGRKGLEDHIQEALKQQAADGSGKPIVVELVIYDLPDRDCAALASNGEISIDPNPPTQPLSGIDTYEQNYINPIADIFQAHVSDPIRFVLVVEDDSLPNLITNAGEAPNPPIANCIAANGGVSGSPSLTGVYVQAITYALNKFHAFPNVYQYLDVGHHGWLGWDHNFQAAIPFFTAFAKQTQAGVASVDGFITNTANYGPNREDFMTADEMIGGQPVKSSNFYHFDTFIDEITYAQAMDQAFVQNGFASTLGFLIDTSRNGWGGPNRPTAASTSTTLETFVSQSKIDRRNDMGQWCNQTGAGIGVPPTVNPGGFPNLQAYVWIKPPGESDGNYPGSNFGGVVSTEGDPNCDPAHNNALANNTPTGAMANSPHAGTFWPAQFISLVQNAFPVLPNISGSGFALTASGATVMQGQTGTSSVTVSTAGGFSSPVTLAVSSTLPAGVTATFSPDTVTGSGSSTLTFTATDTATTGTATVTVTGTGAGTSVNATLTLNVTAEPNVLITASPASLTVQPNTQVSSNLTITCAGGLTGSVSLSATGQPSGVQVNFSPSSVNCPGGPATVSFFVQNGTADSTNTINIVGTNGQGTTAISRMAPITLTVGGGGGGGSFTLASSAASVTLAAGGTVTDTITVTPSGGFNSPVMLALSPLPNGVTGTFAPNPTTSTSVLTLTSATTNAGGTANLTITGTSGTMSATTTVTLNLGGTGGGGFTLNPSAPALTVAQGASATDTITITPNGGFSGPVTLTVTPPPGITVSGCAGATTGSCVLTVNVSQTATAGTSNITISGTGGTTTASASIAVTVPPPNNNGGGFACHVNYAVSSWPGGFNATVNIMNTGTTDITNWTLTWSFPDGQTVTQLWNGNVTQSGSNVSVTSMSYNGNIPAGGSYSGMGFNGSWNNVTNTAPASFAVNGTTCN